MLREHNEHAGVALLLQQSRPRHCPTSHSPPDQQSVMRVHTSAQGRLPLAGTALPFVADTGPPVAGVIGEVETHQIELADEVREVLHDGADR